MIVVNAGGVMWIVKALLSCISNRMGIKTKECTKWGLLFCYVSPIIHNDKSPSMRQKEKE